MSGESGNGTVTFKGTNPGGSGNYAVQGANSAHLTTVQGSGNTGASANGVQPQNGTVTFSITDGTAESVVPVVFQQGSGVTADNLPLNADGTPSVPFGVGGDATFAPAEAATNSNFTSGQVTGFTTKSFTDGNNTYYYGPNDTYKVTTGSGQNAKTSNSTYAEFQQLLSKGDTVSGYYTKTGENGPRVFNLNDQAPTGPTSVTTDTNSTQGGVTVSFTKQKTQEDAQGVASYNVYRAATAAPTTVNGSPTCPDLSTTAAPGAGWTMVKNLPAQPTAAQQSDPTFTWNSTTGTYQYMDTSASAGSDTNNPNQYCYAVSAVAPTVTSTETSPGTGGQDATTSSNGYTPAGTAAPAAGAPKFQSATANASSVTVTYAQDVKTASIDANGSDFKVTATKNGQNYAETVAAATPNSTTANTTATRTVTLTLAPGSTIQDGATVVVRAANGTDGNTVANTATNPQYQAVGEGVQTTADATAPTATTAGSIGAKTFTVTFNEPVDPSTVAKGDFFCNNNPTQPATDGGACTVKSVTLDAANKVATVTVSRALEYADEIGITADSVSDPSGNTGPAMTNTYTVLS